MMMVYYYAVLSTSAAGAAAGCGCSGWEDHPNTLLGDDGSGVVKTGISFDDCREACCESAGCVAFGHCIQDADGSDNAACAYKGAGRCIWYQHNTKSLRRNPGHFTGFQHGDHCKPAPSGGGGGGGVVAVPSCCHILTQLETWAGAGPCCFLSPVSFPLILVPAQFVVSRVDEACCRIATSGLVYGGLCATEPPSPHTPQACETGMPRLHLVPLLRLAQRRLGT
jgi:hypothetical protein